MFVDDDFIKDGQKMVLIEYSTRSLNKTNKIRFYYALKGRDGKSGIVKEDNIMHLGKSVLLVPYSFVEDVKQFLQQWNLPYTIMRVIAGKSDTIGNAFDK